MGSFGFFKEGTFFLPLRLAFELSIDCSCEYLSELSVFLLFLPLVGASCIVLLKLVRIK